MATVRILNLTKKFDDLIAFRPDFSDRKYAKNSAMDHVHKSPQILHNYLERHFFKGDRLFDSLAADVCSPADRHYHSHN